MNELVEKVKLPFSNKNKSPMFAVNNLADDEKCKHYTGFPNYAVFIAVFDLLKPGMNGENVKLVSAPNAHTGRGRGRWLQYSKPNICQLGELYLPSSVSNSNMARKGTSRSSYAPNL